MSDLMKSNWYKVLVVFLVMPICGGFIAKGDLLLGLLLILMQLPWFLTCVINKR